MDIRSVKDALSKATLYATRSDYITSLNFMLRGLREVNSSPGTPPTEIRACIREATKSYTHEQSITDAAGFVITYNPGQEKELHVTLRKIYDILVAAAAAEEYDKALDRKKRLDKHIILGKKYIAEGKIAEADQVLQDGLSYYKDETMLFSYIAKIFLDVNQPTRALFYLKKAVEVDPNDLNAKSIIQDILSKRSEG